MNEVMQAISQLPKEDFHCTRYTPSEFDPWNNKYKVKHKTLPIRFTFNTFGGSCFELMLLAYDYKITSASSALCSDFAKPFKQYIDTQLRLAPDNVAKINSKKQLREQTAERIRKGVKWVSCTGRRILGLIPCWNKAGDDTKLCSTCTQKSTKE